MTITKARPDERSRRALSKATFTCAAALSAAAGIGAFGGESTQAQAITQPTTYTIDRLGYVDAQHTRLDGGRVNNIVDMNRLGQVVGNQFQYDRQTAPTGQTAWFFGVDGLERIGLFDGEFQSAHTSSDDVQVSTVSQLNRLGYAAGVSNRYDSGADLTGQSAWRYFDGENQRVGLFDDDHSTTASGQTSTLVKLNALGTVAGNSERYNGNSAFGYSAYIQRVDDAEATRVGLDLTEPSGTTYNEHHRSDGLQFANVTHLNDSGDAAGFTNRYVQDPDGSLNGFDLAQIGQSAWVRTADGETRKVGFTDAEHTRSSIDGRKVSTVVALNNVGQSVGQSTRYNPSTGSALGQTAWRQRGTETAPTRLGFYDDVHTRGNDAASLTGEKNSVVQQLNDAGYARGFSTRYNGTTTSGQSAWMYSDSDGVERVGLFEPLNADPEESEHTGASGLQHSSVTLLNNVGHAAGTSNRFTEANAAAGTSAWRQFKGGQPAQRIGFYDDIEGPDQIDHTRDDNESRTSTPIVINDLGDVAGHSTRYRNSTAAGQTAWINDGETGLDTRIGLFDFEFTRSPGTDDFQSSTVKFINDNGHVVGTSQRFNGNAQQAGQSGWYYDGTNSIELTFDMDPSQLNRTFTEISFLSNDGVALGYYEKYGTDAGNRAFLWDYRDLDNPATAVDERFHDLGALVEGGLSENGWRALTSAIEMSELGHILGIGTLSSEFDGGSMPFLLTPVPVPEPTSIALVAMAGLALLPRRRRK